MGNIRSKSTNKIEPLKEMNSDLNRFTSYYIDKPLTPKEYILANESWNLILNDKGKFYKKMHPDEKCVVWFYKIFYAYLFELLPDTKRMFHCNMEKQGKMMVKMISYILDSFYNESLHDTICELIKKHIKYFHYTI